MFWHFGLQISRARWWLFAQPWTELFNDSEVNNANPKLAENRALLQIVFHIKRLKKFVIWTFLLFIFDEPSSSFWIGNIDEPSSSLWIGNILFISFDWCAWCQTLSLSVEAADTFDVTQKFLFVFQLLIREATDKHPQLTTAGPPETFDSLDCSLSPEPLIAMPRRKPQHLSRNLSSNLSIARNLSNQWVIAICYYSNNSSTFYSFCASSLHWIWRVVMAIGMCRNAVLYS